MPEYILVGLAYGGGNPEVDRLRQDDLGPPVGGAAGGDYLARLRRCIIPFVETEYVCDPAFRCLPGVSMGGAFALSALFREPGLFQG